jgi:eukaryotic-like serine/threonine-protein kinase
VSALEAARIVAQVAGCVAHSHQHGIVHCDLKPANVLIDDRGAAWLTDFGFARELRSENGQMGNFQYIAGTAAYLAPEQFATGLGQIATATDIHGLGAILFESLTGSPPYAKRTMEALEIGKPDEPINFALIKGAPLLLVEICHRCLDRSPEKRFEDANCVANALRDLGGH